MMKMLEILSLAGFLGFTGFVGGWESTYTRETICTNYTENVYTFTDSCGYDWEWEDGPEVFEIGAKYRLIMDDNHSSSIYDDWIKKIKKEG